MATQRLRKRPRRHGVGFNSSRRLKTAMNRDESHRESETYNGTASRFEWLYNSKVDWNLNHPNPRLFVTSQWPGMSQMAFAIYRCLIAAYALHVSVFIFITNDSGKFYIYLTNWTFVIQSFAFVFKAVVVIVDLRRQRSVIDPAQAMHRTGSSDRLSYREFRYRSLSWNESDKTASDSDSERPDIELSITTETPPEDMAWYLRVEWILHAMYTTSPVLVSTVFWSVLFPKMKDFAKPSTPLSFSYTNYQVHAINSVMAITDLLTSAIPHRPLHIVYVWAFAGSYTLFTYIYYSAGGLDPYGNISIYFFVNWSPGRAAQSAMWCFLVALFSTLPHLFCCSVKATQLWLLRRFRQEDSNAHSWPAVDSGAGVVNSAMTLDEHDSEATKHVEILRFAPSS